MTEACMSEALREAVNEVLETMFFAESEGEAARGGPAEDLAAVRTDFEGVPSGTLTLRIALRAARGIAADFLGEEASDLTPARTVEVVCELANMICGSVLSRVESDTTFRLSAPVAVVETGDVVEAPTGAAACSVQLSGGPLHVRICCPETTS